LYSKRDEYTLFIREDRGAGGGKLFGEQGEGRKSRRGGEIGIIKGIQGNKVRKCAGCSRKGENRTQRKG